MSQYRRVGVATQGKNLLSIVASLGRVEYLFLGGVHVPNLKEKKLHRPPTVSALFFGVHSFFLKKNPVNCLGNKKQTDVKSFPEWC